MARTVRHSLGFYFPGPPLASPCLCPGLVRLCARAVVSQYVLSPVNSALVLTDVLRETNNGRRMRVEMDGGFYHDVISTSFSGTRLFIQNETMRERARARLQPQPRRRSGIESTRRKESTEKSKRVCYYSPVLGNFLDETRPQEKRER